jgi:hypothetical protein
MSLHCQMTWSIVFNIQLKLSNHLKNHFHNLHVWQQWRKRWGACSFSCSQKGYIAWLGCSKWRCARKALVYTLLCSNIHMNISTFGGADPFHKREVNMKFPRNRMLSIKSLSYLIYSPACVSSCPYFFITSAWLQCYPF